MVGGSDRAVQLAATLLLGYFRELITFLFILCEMLIF